MISVLVTGFNTEEEATQFIEWYEGQGEQDAVCWFEARKAEGEIDTSFMPTDLKQTYPIKFVNGQAKLVLRMVE